MEQAKTHKYADRVHRTGALFFPFVMESTGAFGPQAEKFIEKSTTSDVEVNKR